MKLFTIKNPLFKSFWKPKTFDQSPIGTFKTSLFEKAKPGSQPPAEKLNITPLLEKRGLDHPPESLDKVTFLSNRPPETESENQFDISPFLRQNKDIFDRGRQYSVSFIFNDDPRLIASTDKGDYYRTGDSSYMVEQQEIQPTSFIGKCRQLWDNFCDHDDWDV